MTPQRVTIILLSLLLGAALTGWGAWLVAPWETFALSRTYDPLAEIGTETGLGTVLAVIGVLSLCAPWLPRRLAPWALGANLTAWGFITVMFFEGARQSTGVPIYSVLFLAAVFLFFVSLYEVGRA